MFFNEMEIIKFNSGTAKFREENCQNTENKTGRLQCHLLQVSLVIGYLFLVVARKFLLQFTRKVDIFFQWDIQSEKAKAFVFFF